MARLAESLRSRPILLAGITARMLAEMATRSGYLVTSLDYFGDADLRALCPGISLARDLSLAYSPANLVQAAAEITAPYVVYNASLENHPDLVQRLAEGRTLLGNDPETLTAVRNPWRLAEALRSGGFCFPEIRRVDASAAHLNDGRWLWKPLKSGGGHAVYQWSGVEQSGEGILQRHLDGLVCSAAFLANGNRAVLVGLTEQLIGQKAFGADGFRYCGNIIPPSLPRAQLEQLLHEMRAIANHLTDAFDLRGLNGLDFIWVDGHAWTIEVNPRPTAAMELMERAYGLRLFDAHVRAFGGELPSFDLRDAIREAPAAGKAILFTTDNITLGNTTSWRNRGLRDIPYPGERIPAGNPVCTILATAASPEACRQKLEQRAIDLKLSFTQGRTSTRPQERQEIDA
ncbi:MAG: ATP-grasp domain-containing protein [Chloroflexota bacterium]